MNGDAIEVKVHGFESSKEAGDAIEQLLAFGFEVRDVRPTYKGLGTMIETQITCWSDLHTNSVEEIHNAICVKPEIILAIRQFSIVHDKTRLTGEPEAHG